LKGQVKIVKKSKGKKAAKASGKITTVEVKDAIIRGMTNKNAKNIVSLNMEKVQSNLCDFFIICEGTSSVQVNAIANAVEEEVYKLTGKYAYHSEGHENAEWILQDYIDIVVHVFQPQVRSFYNLEGLWGDAEVEEVMVERQFKRM
jgi:ribosome-associated protein